MNLIFIAFAAWLVLGCYHPYPPSSQPHPLPNIAATYTPISTKQGQMAVTGTDAHTHTHTHTHPAVSLSLPPSLISPILFLRLPLSVPHHSPCPCFWSSNAGRDNDYKSGMKVSDHNVAHPSQLAFLLPSYDASSWLFLRTRWTAPWGFHIEFTGGWTQLDGVSV